MFGMHFIILQMTYLYKYSILVHKIGINKTPETHNNVPKINGNIKHNSKKKKQS